MGFFVNQNIHPATCEIKICARENKYQLGCVFFLPPLENTMQRRVCKVIGHAHFTVCVLASCDTVDNSHFRMLGPEAQFTEGVTSGYWNT